MSRVGKKPVPIPAGVKVDVTGRTVQVEGPKGKLSFEFHPAVSVSVAGGRVSVERKEEHRLARALHGTTRQLIGNMIDGCTRGFEKQLEIVGVGYNAKVEKQSLVLQIGFCLPTTVPIPKGIEVTTPKNTIILIKGCDKQQVGQFAAEIRGLRPPEPYKGKGIKYDKEVLRRKAAKSIGTTT